MNQVETVTMTLDRYNDLLQEIKDLSNIIYESQKKSSCVFISENEVEYSTVPTIIAFRNINDAQRLNKTAKKKNLPVRGVYVGEILRGFNIKGNRPQVLIMTFECSNNIESEWLDETIKCMAEGFSLIIGSGDQNIISY